MATKAVASTDERAVQMASMMDNLPINVLFCDPDFTITYMNKASDRTLRTIQELLPCPVDDIIGKSIDLFHKDPSHQRKILGNPNNLPHSAVISLGPEKLDLLTSVVRKENGDLIGFQVTWSVVTIQKEVESQLNDAVERLQTSATTLKEVSSTMAAAAEETSNQSAVVSSAAEEVNANMSTVASAAEEMTSSIKEISNNASEAARVSQEAVSVATSTNETINSLGERSEEIGNVIKVISSIAQQTNLLALNATIEAARAGEAGKGFAVVANEVKELAKQTAGATDDITVKIEAIQSTTNDAVRAIGEISNIIGAINDISSTIASAVEEQAATTNEISRNVAESATGAQEIAQNITGVATAANETANGANQNLTAADNLSALASELGNLLNRMQSERANV